MDIDLTVMLANILNHIGPKLVSKHMKAQAAGNETRATMALAQVVIYTKLLERYQEDDEYYHFILDLQLLREAQEEFYLESRADNNRKLALVVLSRLRFLAMLQRQLAAAERNKAMETLRTTRSIVRH
ncbi:hypothetical protein [Geomonas anaerohicana]|uniref:Uncharacterized protein n=1 Tax=Geomonas anaerohicana TaxID=2798583 RepID=A0ABS0YB46_9BACT|nr:hypothetical protein [Geomonas anaerohicana]MBJ6749147.1 hypothetical protein [Geomonas anaerohicana]